MIALQLVTQNAAPLSKKHGRQLNLHLKAS